MKFGDFAGTKILLQNIHGAIVLGILGGMLGSLFINVNTRMGRIRKRFVNTKCKKIVETGMFAVITISLAFWLTAGLNKCKGTKATFTADELELPQV